MFWGAGAPSVSVPGVSRKAAGSILWKFSVSRTVLASSCCLTCWIDRVSLLIPTQKRLFPFSVHTDLILCSLTPLTFTSVPVMYVKAVTDYSPPRSQPPETTGASCLWLVGFALIRLWHGAPAGGAIHLACQRKTWGVTLRGEKSGPPYDSLPGIFSAPRWSASGTSAAKYDWQQVRKFKVGSERESSTTGTKWGI